MRLTPSTKRSRSKLPFTRGESHLPFTRGESHLPFTWGVPALLWQVIFFYIPLAFITLSGFIKISELGAFDGFTLKNFTLFFTPTYLKVTLASLLMALTNALICFAIAFPLAYYIAFTGRKYKNSLLFFLIVPFWTNFLLHVYAWFYVHEKHGFINTLLMKLGLIAEPLNMLNSLFAIMIMMVYYYLPFMVLPIYSSLERFNETLLEASYDLGGNFFTTFRKIMLPLTSRGIRSGFFLVLIPSFGEFAIPELMGGDKKMFVGTVISQYILGEGTGSLGAAFTLLSGLILLIVVVGLNFFLTSILKPRMQNG